MSTWKINLNKQTANSFNGITLQMQRFLLEIKLIETNSYKFSKNISNCALDKIRFNAYFTKQQTF